MTMQRASIQPSTAISSVEWDDDTLQMTVTFASGASYDFSDVPENIFRGFETAASPGAYYHNYVKGSYS